MRILYIDIDTLRPDHLGCYGYHRNTSPNIDRIAEQAVRFENNYVSDAPCLPSRTALWSGRCGFRTGVVGHMATAADPFIEGPTRGFRDTFAATSWMSALRQVGLQTVTVSPFGERHAAWQWYAGYKEMYNPGKGGMERADEVVPIALDWIKRNVGSRNSHTSDDWFLHVNVWDPHTPYRTPMAYGNPFEDDPLPAWLTEDVWQRGWEGFGPHSPQEPHGFSSGAGWLEQYERVPKQIDSMAAVKQWIDGYDTGIWYADKYVGKLLDALEEAGVLDETVIIVSSDHAESQGEFNVWGDHQTADHSVSRVPLLIRWPGLTDTPRVDRALHYHFDWAATLVELAGGQVPGNWDAVPFTEAFEAGEEKGRDYLVLSQGAWSVQRSVRFNYKSSEAQAPEAYICLRTYHDGYKMLEPVMLFNLTQDPHEQTDLAQQRPELVDKAMGMLADWRHRMMLRSRYNVDPLMTVLREGGPSHTRGELPAYLERLHATGRAHHAERLLRLHPEEA
jgi:arylsulfatase A-like enzyme